MKKKAMAGLKLKKETLLELSTRLQEAVGAKTATTGTNSACGSCNPPTACTTVTAWCVG